MAPKANLADFLAALLDTIFVLTGGLLILTGLAGGVDGGVGAEMGLARGVCGHAGRAENIDISQIATMSVA